MKRIIPLTSAWVFLLLSFEPEVRQQTNQPPQHPRSETHLDQSQATSKELERIFNEDQSDSRPYSTPQQKRETDVWPTRRFWNDGKNGGALPRHKDAKLHQAVIATWRELFVPGASVT